MASFTYVAFDRSGRETRGTLRVGDQAEAIERIREMGCFPTRLEEVDAGGDSGGVPRRGLVSRRIPAALRMRVPLPRRRVGVKALMVLTRQLATLVEAGLPLLRGLRLLGEQEERPEVKALLLDLGWSIEGGNSFSEALARHGFCGPGLGGSWVTGSSWVSRWWGRC